MLNSFLIEHSTTTYINAIFLFVLAGGASYNYYAKPSSVQNPWLVSQQAEGYQGWQVLTGMGNCPWTYCQVCLFWKTSCQHQHALVLDSCQQSWEQATWGPWKVEEDSCSSWSSSLLGVSLCLLSVDWVLLIKGSALVSH